MWESPFYEGDCEDWDLKVEGTCPRSYSLMCFKPTISKFKFPRSGSFLLMTLSSVQLLSRVWLFATPWTTARQASLSITNSRSLLKLTSIESVMPYDHLILCHPLLLLPSIFSSIRVFSSESVLCIRWPKYWSFSFNINPSNEYSGLISFRMDWLDLLAVHGTLKSLLQYHSSKASILWHSAWWPRAALKRFLYNKTSVCMCVCVCVCVSVLVAQLY